MDINKFRMTLEEFQTSVNKQFAPFTKNIVRPLEDCNGLPIVKGSIFDIKQTVNGCSIFILSSVEPLEVHYFKNGMVIRKYEYDVISLLDLDKWETEIEVIDFIDEL